MGPVLLLLIIRSQINGNLSNCLSFCLSLSITRSPFSPFFYSLLSPSPLFSFNLLLQSLSLSLPSLLSISFLISLNFLITSLNALSKFQVDPAAKTEGNLREFQTEYLYTQRPHEWWWHIPIIPQGVRNMIGMAMGSANI